MVGGCDKDSGALSRETRSNSARYWLITGSMGNVMYASMPSLRAVRLPLPPGESAGNLCEQIEGHTFMRKESPEHAGKASSTPGSCLLPAVSSRSCPITQGVQAIRTFTTQVIPARKGAALPCGALWTLQLTAVTPELGFSPSPARASSPRTRLTCGRLGAGEKETPWTYCQVRP